MKQSIELLAPAGTYEAFLAAVENGADAIYLGGKLFNARANASNFDLIELKKMVEYAHLRDVKIHLTMNTLLDDAELEEALEFAYQIYEIGVDAVIVQDLGLAKLLHEAIPDLALHASTQISAHTLEGVNTLASLGFSRVVLARELSLEEIRNICENTKTEIEIFAHGALCVSYSGQCLMSSMIGDRSGNRGKCAQPCRMPYQFIQNTKPIGSGYLLSPKDLSTLEILKELPNVACLKIEGRMKSPEYVATVIHTYRKYLDTLQSPTIEDKNNLAQIFNRGGFSQAYLYGKSGKDMMCYEKPKNWGTYLGKVTNYDGKRYITLDHMHSLKIGDGIEIWNGSNTSPSTIVSEIIGNQIGRIHGEIHIGDKVYKTSDKLLNQKAKESFSRGFVKHTMLNLTITIKENQPIQLKITRTIPEKGKNPIFPSEFLYTSTYLPEKAQKQPLTQEKIIACFQKTGNTPFEIKEFSIELGNELFLPISTLNEICRQALEAYEKEILTNHIKKIERKPFSYFLQSEKNQPICSSVSNTYISITPSIATKTTLFNSSDINTFETNASKKVSVHFIELRKEYQKLKNVDSFYISLKDAMTHIDWLENWQAKKFIVLPTITKGNYATLIKNNLAHLASIVDGFVLSHIGQLEYFKNISTTLIANYTFNTFNSLTVQLLQSLGFSKVILSPELTKQQINTIASTVSRTCNKIQDNRKIDLEVMAYGNLCVMTSEYCPIGSLVGGLSSNQKCSKPCLKKDIYYLRDRMHFDFRIIPDNIDCQSKIYNAKTTSFETKELNVNSIRFDFIDESLLEIQKIIKIHHSGKKIIGEQYTNGHLNRPV